MKWRLDTDSIRFALGSTGGMAERLRAKQPSQIRDRSITAMEFSSGVARRRSKKHGRLVQVFLDAVEVVPFAAAAASRFARWRLRS